MYTSRSIYAKIERAEDAFNELHADVEKFCERQRSRIEIKGQGCIFLHAETPPIDWSIRIGEIAHNLRSSLAYLVWKLVLDNDGEPDRNNEFPIFLFYSERPKTDRLLKGVSDEHKRKILHLQRCIALDMTVLWDLKALCNIDKHRHPNFVRARLNGLSQEYRQKEEQWNEEKGEDDSKEAPPINRDDIVVECEFLGDASNDEHSFSHAEIVSTLKDCIAAVRGAVEYVISDCTLGYPYLR